MPAEWEALPITAGQAREHLGWQYEPPYGFLQYRAKAVGRMLRPMPGGYYAVHRGGKMAGYFELHCRGKTVEIGVALRPDLTGKGHGRAFLACVLAQAWQFFAGTVRFACGGMERAGAAALSGGGLSGGWPGVLANRRERCGFYPHGDARPGFFRKNLKKACNMAGL